MLWNSLATAVLFAFWLLLSGYFDDRFLVLSGLGCAVAVALFTRRMAVIDREGHPYHLTWAALFYWPWLVKEIAKSALTVSRIILHPKLPISPTMVRFRPGQRTAVGLVTHANSITLTPGTLTVEATRDEFVVHGLTRDGAHGAIDSEMDRRVCAMEASD